VHWISISPTDVKKADAAAVQLSEYTRLKVSRKFAVRTACKALDKGFGVDVISLVYRKAFDNVPHNRLMLKRTNLGLHGDMLRWIRNFITRREMRVGLRGSFSTRADILIGIQQGSILGPLLFLLFVNVLPAWTKNEMMMFADDTTLWCKISQQADGISLQNDLRQLELWTDKWQLAVNPDKCKVMHLGHDYSTTYELHHNGIPGVLDETVEETDLRV